MLIGALETGGTRMVCVVGKEDGTVLGQVSTPTTTPEKTTPKLIEYFKDKEIGALGVAIFGPVGMKPGSETYGYILDAPKLAWRYKDLLGRLKAELRVPMGPNMDVGGSCLGEVAYECTRRPDNVIYITTGIGVGAGVYINGKLLHGMLHPEGGHILLARHKDDSKGGICPYHKNCLEGFASGLSIEARWDKKVVELVDRPKVWEMEGYYVAQALMDHIMPLSPRRTILGGGVIYRERLSPTIRQKVREMLDGYIKTKEPEDMDSYTVPASLHDDQGVMGCIKLGLNALQA